MIAGFPVCRDLHEGSELRKIGEKRQVSMCRQMMT